MASENLLQLSQKLIKNLTTLSQTVSFAESLTGGRASDTLISVSGASKVMLGGIVCYTKLSKEKIVGVPSHIIEDYGMVSSQCAAAMAQGVKNLHGSDYGLSFTGVAGSDSMEGKDVGTVFVGLATPENQTFTIELDLDGDRESIRSASVSEGFEWFLNKINE